MAIHLTEFPAERIETRRRFLLKSLLEYRIAEVDSAHYHYYDLLCDTFFGLKALGAEAVANAYRWQRGLDAHGLRYAQAQMFFEEVYGFLDYCLKMEYEFSPLLLPFVHIRMSYAESEETEQGIVHTYQNPHFNVKQRSLYLRPERRYKVSFVFEEKVYPGETEEEKQAFSRAFFMAYPHTLKESFLRSGDPSCMGVIESF